MTATLIDGKKIAQTLKDDLKHQIVSNAAVPCLALVLVGDNPASLIYVNNKKKACKDVGITSIIHHLPADTPQETLIALIHELNSNKDVHGILVQMPLPSHIENTAVIKAIDPNKDVDGFHPINVGALVSGDDSGFKPCTPIGVMHLIRHALGNDLSGKEAVVIGRSSIVGRPLAQLLLQADCTVTQCHSRTHDLKSHVSRADIVVSAVGKPAFIKGDWIKKGACVIDVGINRITIEGSDKTKLIGDVDTKAAAENAAFITPVPGGVGPMTIACLLENTFKAFKRQQ